MKISERGAKKRISRSDRQGSKGENHCTLELAGRLIFNCAPVKRVEKDKRRQKDGKIAKNKEN